MVARFYVVQTWVRVVVTIDLYQPSKVVRSLVSSPPVPVVVVVRLGHIVPCMVLYVSVIVCIVVDFHHQRSVLVDVMRFVLVVVLMLLLLGILSLCLRKAV